METVPKQHQREARYSHETYAKISGSTNLVVHVAFCHCMCLAHTSRHTKRRSKQALTLAITDAGSGHVHSTRISHQPQLVGVFPRRLHLLCFLSPNRHHPSRHKHADWPQCLDRVHLWIHSARTTTGTHAVCCTRPLPPPQNETVFGIVLPGHYYCILFCFSRTSDYLHHCYTIKDN